MILLSILMTPCSVQAQTLLDVTGVMPMGAATATVTGEHRSGPGSMALAASAYTPPSRWTVASAGERETTGGFIPILDAPRFVNDLTVSWDEQQGLLGNFETRRRASRRGNCMGIVHVTHHFYRAFHKVGLSETVRDYFFPFETPPGADVPESRLGPHTEWHRPASRARTAELAATLQRTPPTPGCRRIDSLSAFVEAVRQEILQLGTAPFRFQFSGNAGHSVLAHSVSRGEIRDGRGRRVKALLIFFWDPNRDAVRKHTVFQDPDDVLMIEEDMQWATFSREYIDWYNRGDTGERGPLQPLPVIELGRSLFLDDPDPGPFERALGAVARERTFMTNVVRTPR